MEQIASVSTVEDDAHGLVVNLIELIHKVESKAAYYGAAGTNQSRIENFKV